MIDAAAAGDTVYLHEGTYHEHIILKQGVDLAGEDRETTIIHGDYQTQAHVIRALGENRIENVTISGGGAYSGAYGAATASSHAPGTNRWGEQLYSYQ